MGKRSASGKPRQYTVAEKREAIELSLKVGSAGAARELQMPVGTVSCWLTKYRRGQLKEVDEPASKSVQDDAEAFASNAVSDTTDTSAQQAPTRRVAKVYTPSQKAEILEYADKHGVTEAHRRFDVSRFSIYKWRDQRRRAAKGEGPSPTSGPDPADVEAKRDREILDEWERHPGLGPSQIKNQLRRKGIRISTNTVRRVMLDAGYRPPRRKTGKHDRRYEAVRPNHIWHLDFVMRYIHRAKTFTLILLDDCSRFVLGHGVDDAERADMVIETFQRAVERHGKPERVVHDKGSAFWAWRGIGRFTQLLEEMEVEQIPASKQTNGKLETFCS